MESSNTASIIATAVSKTAGTIGGSEGPGHALSDAVLRAAEVAEAHELQSWLGLLARIIFWIVQAVSMILYFVLKLATFSVPSLLFTLFSTSLTFTMNATTL
jgi:lysophospholipid hydrolase